jgi:hypothetical protein
MIINKIKFGHVPVRSLWQRTASGFPLRKCAVPFLHFARYPLQSLVQPPNIISYFHKYFIHCYI